MTVGFVIGNGESRMGFPLESLRGYGQIWGCNALYRDFLPDTLVAVDPPTVAEIRQAAPKTNLLTVCRTTRAVELNGVEIEKVQKGRGWWCGPTAIYFMLRLHPEITDVYLLGFDLWGNAQGLYNNIYKNTPNYCSDTTVAVPNPNISEMKEKCFLTYPLVNFYRVGALGDMPAAWLGLGNIHFISYEHFQHRMVSNALVTPPVINVSEVLAGC